TAAAMVGRELQGIGGSSWPALAELHAQGQSGIFNERLIDLTRLVAILAFAGLVPIAVYNQFFVTRWVGAAQYGGEMLTLVAFVNGLLTACFTLATSAMTATERVPAMLPGPAAQ